MKKFIFIFVILTNYVLQCLCDCILLPTKNATDRARENALLDVIKPLKEYTFKTKDVVSPAQYEYKVSICGKMEGQTSSIGAIQQTTNKTEILGRLDMSDIMGGTDWILLTYYGGNAYGSHCNYSSRVAKIMIICNPDALVGKFDILEERNTLESGCYYLFELGSNVSCNNKPKMPSGLSSGSVFCILFFTFACVYLIIGFLYKRIVMGAQGLEQIPNYTFWRNFGNLQADGCDYFCRWGPRQESQAYRGIDEHLKAEEERDDQLLNM